MDYGTSTLISHTHYSRSFSFRTSTTPVLSIPNHQHHCPIKNSCPISASRHSCFHRSQQECSPFTPLIADVNLRLNYLRDILWTSSCCPLRYPTPWNYIVSLISHKWWIVEVRFLLKNIEVGTFPARAIAGIILGWTMEDGNVMWHQHSKTSEFLC